MLFGEGYARQTTLLWIIFFCSLLNLFLFIFWLPEVLHLIGMTPAQAVFVTSLYPLVLDLYDQILRKSGDRFQKEAAIHNLIFPMGKEHSGTQAFLKHNLWLIDERLTYANYIASDKQIRTHKPLFDVSSQGEPDLALYYNLGFSSDSLDDVLRNVVIVEFKRPGRLEQREENPTSK